MPIVLKRCAECARELPLQLFRRRRGRKSHMADVCKVCNPERTLSKRSTTELKVLVEQGRANPVIVEAIKRRRREHWTRSLLPARKTQQYRTERRRNWNVLLLDGLRDELVYAKRRQREHAAEHAQYLAGERGPVSAQCAQWVVFFEEYAQTLKKIINRAARLIPVPGSPVKPTIDEINPRYWLSDDEFAALHITYSSCVYIPGRRARTPHFLRWAEIKGRKTGESRC